MSKNHQHFHDFFDQFIRIKFIAFLGTKKFRLQSDFYKKKHVMVTKIEKKNIY